MSNPISHFGMKWFLIFLMLAGCQTEQPALTQTAIPSSTNAILSTETPHLPPTTASQEIATSLTSSQTREIQPEATSNEGTTIFSKVDPAETTWQEWATTLNLHRGVYSENYAHSATAVIEKTILTDLSTGTIKWEAVKPPAPVNSTNSLVFSHDSRFLANGGDEEVVYIYSTDNGELVKEIPFASTIGNLAFSMDDRYLAVSTICGQIQPCAIQLFDLIDEDQISFPDQLYFSNLTFSPNNQILAIGRTNDTLNLENSPVILWDIDTNSMQELPVPDLQVVDKVYPKLMQFSPDGRLLAFLFNTTLQLWDAENQAYLNLNNNELEGYPLSLVFSPDGQFVSLITNYNRVHVWSTSGNYLGNIEKTSGLSKAFFTPDSNYLLLLTHDGNMELWAVQ